MAISTNSIIHYTKSLDNLLGILEYGFSLKYCKEEFFGGTTKIRYAYPMVCFCDIPLSEAKNHLDSYGYYGIGLKKDWAIKKGLNPVLYLERNSALASSVMQQAKRINENRTELLNNSNTIKIEDVWRDEFRNLCSFLKNYDGDLIINQKTIPHYRFYNEREWRYVPKQEDLGGNLPAIYIDKYLEKKDEYNSKLRDIKLEFNIPKDISYVIVKEDEDINKTLDFISQKFKKKLLASDIEILMTKILCANQIINDF